jgi:mannosyltransferase OCH1-like enzyme
MITKIIHYCWFGGNQKTELVANCVASWKKYLPDYEIIEWNEHNFDINHNFFVKTAYNQKKWAFVSDYVRAYALYQHGGIYLDSDVEIRNNLDEFLIHGAFSGFEIKGYPFTAVWGSEKHHIWVQRVLEYYDRLTKFELVTNTVIVTNILIEHYNINVNNDSIQYLDDNIVIYSSEYFCLDIPKNYAVHHFSGSWIEGGSGAKQALNKQYLLEKYTENVAKGNILEDLYNYKVINFRYIIKFLIIKSLRILKHKVYPLKNG